MVFGNPLFGLPFGDLFQTLLPDLVLAFTFFTSLAYAVLGRKLDRQRPAAAMSAALGMALSVGLVWWEHTNNWTIRDLGPLAVGFALLALAGIMFQSIRQVGGSWAGSAIALAITMFVGSILGVHWPWSGLLQQFALLMILIAGVGAFLMHRRGKTDLATTSPWPAKPVSVRNDLDDLYRDRKVSEQLDSGMEHVRRESDWLGRNRDTAADIKRQLERMLPAEGWLTRRLADLREKAYRIRVGHLAQINELQVQIRAMPAGATKTAASGIKSLYKELQFDTRLERLDKSVAETERRIREVTGAAIKSLERHEYRKVPGLLDQAKKLQHHNTALIRNIERTEERLLALARKALYGKKR